MSPVKFQHAPVLVVVVVIDGHAHNFSSHNPKPFPLCGLGLHVPPHFVHAIVIDFEISLSHLIGDEEKSILGVLAVISSAHPPVICQKYCGLIVLVQDIILNHIPLCLHKILTPHHHPKDI